MDAHRPLSGYRDLPHTADIALEVFAPSLEELFQNAAYGLYHILGIQQTGKHAREVELHFEGMDAESLLVAILNELLYYVGRGMIAAKMDIRFSSRSVYACANLISCSVPCKEVKAVTYNLLKITRDENGWRTPLVFDV